MGLLVQAFGAGAKSTTNYPKVAILFVHGIPKVPGR
jgi:hypothetical protein